MFETHALTAARNLIGSTLFGMAMTCGLHWYKGMVTGLAMQTVLSPLTTYDSPIIKAVWTSLYQQMFSSSTTTTKSTTLVTPEHRWFGEKLSLQELDPETEQAVDEQGNPIEIVGTGRITNNTNNANASTTTKGQPKPRSVQDIMLDTWDQGPNADVSELSAALFVDKKDPLVITTTINDLWTPLMILCGLASDNVAATETRRKLIKQQEKDGADALLKAVDTDGWTALHWAAFHGNVTAADDLFQLANKNDTVTSVLVHARDKDDKTPVEIAQQEGNMDVVHIIQEQMKLKGGADISTTTAEPKKEK